ncbi:MAG: hypothetical protein M3Y87_27455 [Myxococcota bacterium]|nr:hypothetical protein [Myxococcota bacterium]
MWDIRRAAAPLMLLVLAACGSTPTVPREPVSTADTTVSEPDAIPSEGAASDDPSVPPDERPCDALVGSECATQGPRCVWDRACRDAVDECEGVVPEPSWNQAPVFDRGDPCENVRPGCGWSPTLHRCAVFAPVAECPATLEDARAASVLCNHSGQAPLECRYSQTRCVCFAPTYCGGAHPPPTMTPSPAAFVCIPPVDDQGCPTGEIRAGTPCRLEPSITCMSCSTAARCVRNRWQVHVLPPRP